MVIKETVEFSAEWGVGGPNPIAQSGWGSGSPAAPTDPTEAQSSARLWVMLWDPST